MSEKNIGDILTANECNRVKELFKEKNWHISETSEYDMNSWVKVMDLITEVRDSAAEDARFMLEMKEKIEEALLT